MADGCEELLINVNSPENANNVPCHKSYLKNPLIPAPDVNCNLEINNPFDVVAISAENWDPFELVLRESLKKIVINQDSKLEHGKKAFKSHRIFKTPSPRREKVDKIDGNPRKVLRSQSVTDNIMCFSSPGTSSDKLDSDSSKPLDDNWSIREKIKKVVKRRVSECIENALNQSLSQPDLRKTEASSLKCMSNILSQIACISPEAKLDDDTKVFINETQNAQFISNEIKSNNGSITPQEFGNQSSFIIQGNKSEKDGVNPPEELTKKENFFEILEEAKQMSFVFQNMSLSEACKNDNSKLVEENLMDVKPPWEENDESPFSSESEDSSIGLPKVKLFYMRKKENRKNQEISAEELARYKKRIRASFDGNMSCDEEPPLEKTELAVDKPKPADSQHVINGKDFQSAPKEMEPLEPVAVNKPTAVLPVANELRPKKRGSILKKGPMKALVPLQKMTKSIAEKMSSPLKKSSQLNGSCVKTKQDSSFSSSIIHPVAASTPNGKETIKKHVSETPTSFRNRLSRKDSGIPAKGSSKRSVSLTCDSRKTNGKLPFSAVDSNVKTNKRSPLNRPHTAPSKTSQSSFDKASPKSKNNSLRKNTLASNDKENRVQVF